MLQQIELPCQHPGELHLVQLTDTHISADVDATLAGVNTAETLLDVLAALKHGAAPDAVLLTGDLAETPSAAAYNRLAGMLRDLDAPVFCLPGNHDDPALMRRRLNRGKLSTARFLTGRGWSVILLNSHVPGEHGGELSAAELARLDTALAHADDKHADNKHVLVCLHHPPVSIDSPWMDAMALKNGAALFRVLDRHDSVRAVIWGHIHQEFSTSRNGVLLLGSPSTCVQFKPHATQAGTDSKPPAYRTLVLAEDGEIRTRVHWL